MDHNLWWEQFSSSPHWPILDWESLSRVRNVTDESEAQADNPEAELRATVTVTIVVASITLATDHY